MAKSPASSSVLSILKDAAYRPNCQVGVEKPAGVNQKPRNENVADCCVESGLKAAPVSISKGPYAGREV